MTAINQNLSVMKQLLLFLSVSLLIFLNGHSQSSGTFTGVTSDTNPSDTYSFTASGNGKYLFTGTYTNTADGWVTPTAYVGTVNNYNIGGNYDTNGILDFETDCVQTGQTIGLFISASGNHSYTISYQFVPLTYEPNTLDNDERLTASRVEENTVYSGQFSVAGSDPNSSELPDWYFFESPRNGTLIINLDKGVGHRGSQPYLNLSTSIIPVLPASNINESETSNIYVFEDIASTGAEFFIEISGGCTSYQFSWSIQSAASTLIPDANFEQLLVDLGYDNVIDGEVLTENIENVIDLEIPALTISDLTGIEDFTALENFDLRLNSVANLNFSSNLSLKGITVYNNPLTSVNITQNTLLTDLIISNTTEQSFSNLDNHKTVISRL